MPIYDYYCEGCERTLEVIEITPKNPQCCGSPMNKKIGLPVIIRIDGQGYPSRRKWMDNWTPDSPPFQIGSIHGEKY